MRGTIPDNSTEFNYHLKGLLDFYRRPARKLVDHLYSKGYSQRDLAKILGVSQAAINLQFPKNQMTGGSK